MTTPVRKRDREAILSALRAGVVPHRGLRHLQVGRDDEISALSDDIEMIKDGGATIRFAVGPYGSGKSFFLQVIRSAAQSAGLVTMNADVAQDARLYGTGGRVRSLFSTLVASAGTKTQPDGGAMAEVLERFVGLAQEKARKTDRDVADVVREQLADLRQYRNGHEFSDVVLAYWEGVRRHDDERREAAVRWLRGEYRTRTEARVALGVTGVIGDDAFYDSLRLLALLVHKAGYGGLMVEFDELAVLARLNGPTRMQNYEQILHMINNQHAGHARHLGIVFAGTPEFVSDPIRGLYSYGALRQRLSPNEFLRPGLRDTASPVISLQPLSIEDLMVLLENVHTVFKSNQTRDPLPDRDRAVAAFTDHATGQLGGIEHLTPREVTRSWLQFLDVLHQNPREQWEVVLGAVPVVPDLDDGFADGEDDGDAFAALVGAADARGTGEGDGTHGAEEPLRDFAL